MRITEWRGSEFQVLVSGRISFLSMDLLIDLFKQMLAHNILKLFFIHEPGGHLFVLLHPVDEDVLQHREELIPEIFHGICHGSLPEINICDCILPDGIKDELVCGIEIGPESIVEDINQFREFDFVPAGNTGPHSARAVSDLVACGMLFPIREQKKFLIWERNAPDSENCEYIWLLCPEPEERECMSNSIM